MKLLVVGGGGREHAIIRKLKEDPRAEIVYALPGNAGIAEDAVCVPIGAKELDKIVAFAVEKGVDFAVVAPDDPLAMGLVDRLHEKGVACFGPTAAAARIEASKVFAKDLMKRYGIPTARCEIFSDPQSALAYLQTAAYPAVVKADGLALGKGVVIAQNYAEAEAAINGMMTDKIFGDSGNTVVVEEFLQGPEVSVLALCDGKTLRPLVSSMDHKRAHDGDTGPNTGGMGTVAPNPFYTPAIAERCRTEIFEPTVAAMAAEGCPFKGCLYFGLMLTADGPKVIEYNCRFGDPETQVVLPLLKTSLLELMLAVEQERLADAPFALSNGAACCLILASGGYPGHYEKGKPITVDTASLPADVHLCHAGTARKDGQLVTAGGRVIGLVAEADSLQAAVESAYRARPCVAFEGAFCRSDIGARALNAAKSTAK